MKPKLFAAGLALVVVASLTLLAVAQQADPGTVERYVDATFKGAPAEWRKRIEQDEVQRLCSQYRNQLPPDLFQKVLAGQRAAVVLPADGNVMGNWKDGEAVAQNGRGGQFSD